MNVDIIILGAGKGKRMNSDLPKVLHLVGGQTILEHDVAAVQGLNPNSINVIYGHNGVQVCERLSHLPVNWVEQKQQLGTGHAVSQALPNLSDDNLALILLGDVPLITKETLQSLLDVTPAGGVGLLTAEVDDPTGLGRILRDDNGNVTGIIEHADASDAQRQINEINTGIMAAPVKLLKQWLSQVDNNNAQGEYYLTDVPAIAIKAGHPVTSALATCPTEVLGINDRQQLARLERYYQQREVTKLLLNGASVRDPARVDIRGPVICGRDVSIDINCILANVEIGNNVTIGANCILRNVKVADNVTIKDNSLLEDAILGEGAEVGPFARLRPGAELLDNAKVGNFVEVKKSTIGEGSKVSHLTYIGDATIGKHVNVGAGTITCNYDGVNKYPTVIEDDAFIGSGVQLVAPVTIKHGATIGAGSVITKEAPADTLSVARGKQMAVPGWERPVKEKK
ncbi:MAG: UDP-N-acetylglucosamine diphosphorylase/glucosamine-1-phosphate N-acetyltransferase [Legionellales bacterium]|nr:UDP-N-acetylglucosamine diphosphorylase/glucosamine-1-phosphate N-acetyltransferase [Legionellales bacterium]